MDIDVITGIKGTGLDAWSKKTGLGRLFARNLAAAIDDPDETPYLLRRITEGFQKLRKPAKKEVRQALIRVQIYCSIHGNSDPIKLSKQLFVSHTIERLLFGSNLLMTEGPEGDEIELKK